MIIEMRLLENQRCYVEPSQHWFSVRNAFQPCFRVIVLSSYVTIAISGTGQLLFCILNYSLTSYTVLCQYFYNTANRNDNFFFFNSATYFLSKLLTPNLKNFNHFRTNFAPAWCFIITFISI